MVSLFGRRSSSRQAVAEVATPPSESGLEALTGEWMIDPGHSRIGFSVRHAMVTTVRGAFTEFEGRAYLDGREPERSRAEVVMSVASVDTGVEQRDRHLVGRDFLDAASYPQIRFASKGVEVVEPDVYRMAGELAIRDVARPVALELTYIGCVTDPFGYERIGFDGTTTINRSDWGLTYDAKLADGGALVSEKVRLQFDLAAIRTAPAG